MFSTPILLIIFNRPELESKVLDSLQLIKPSHLFIAADGPRSNVISDIQLCAEARKMIEERVTWDCTIHKLYREVNLGCGKAVSDAVTWFFNHVEQGIIDRKSTRLNSSH